MSFPPVARQDWASHPNFPKQALLLRSHANFRWISRHLVDEVQKGTDARPLASLYRRWIGAMRSHEAYEERKLYPYLQRRFGQDFGEARAGHEALHERHDEVLAAFEAAREEEPGATNRLARALEAHDEALVAHLALEEELVIPPLLALSRAEFEDYSAS